MKLMSEFSRRFSTLAPLGLVLALASGCYQAQDKIFASGVDAGLQSGRYVCREPDGSRPTTVTLDKQAPSPGDTVYAYDWVQSGGNRIKSNFRFGKLKSGLLLMQAEGDERGLYTYLFVAIDTPKSFAIAVPPGDNSARAARFGVTLKSGDELAGPAASIRAFLESFAPTDVARSSFTQLCNRQDA